MWELVQQGGLWAIFQKGGWVLWPIFFGSVLGVAFFAERFWALQRARVNPPELLRRLLVLLRRGQWNEARLVCQAHSSALARIMWLGLTQYEQSSSRDILQGTFEEAGQREAFLLERGVGALGVVASLEPLLGLLGTVLGMIEAFIQVEQSGGGDPRTLAGGVWVALLTTAAGLMVAIPAYVAYRFLLSRVDQFVLELQNDVALLAEALHANNEPLPVGAATSEPVGAGALFGKEPPPSAHTPPKPQEELSPPDPPPEEPDT